MRKRTLLPVGNGGRGHVCHLVVEMGPVGTQHRQSTPPQPPLRQCRWPLGMPMAAASVTQGGQQASDDSGRAAGAPAPLCAVSGLLQLLRKFPDWATAPTESSTRPVQCPLTLPALLSPQQGLQLAAVNSVSTTRPWSPFLWETITDTPHMLSTLVRL